MQIMDQTKMDNNSTKIYSKLKIVIADLIRVLTSCPFHKTKRIIRTSITSNYPI